MTRPKAGERRRCTCEGTDDCIHTKPCRQFARRGTVPARCHRCGAGTRAEQSHGTDPDTGAPKATRRGMITIPARVQALLDGTLDVADMDDEELARGYPRAEDGTFRGRPNVVPTAVHQRIQRELFARAGEQLKSNLIAAVTAMTNIATDDKVDASTRIKAATWVVERTMGKTPDITVTMEEKRYERLLHDMDRGAIPVDVEDDGRQA